jgi:hypothetical protein
MSFRLQFDYDNGYSPAPAGGGRRRKRITMITFRSSFVSVAFLALATPSLSCEPPFLTSDVVEHAADSASAVWSMVEPGVKVMPTLTIADSIYPDAAGVQFLVNGKPDDRYPKVRPDGFDATGPQDESTFHVYPSLTPKDGTVLEARWTDRSGTDHVSEHVVGTDAPSDAPFPAAGLVNWTHVGAGTTSMPTVTIHNSIYPNQRGVQLFVNSEPDDRSPKARPDGWDATGPQHQSTFHHYPKLALRTGMKLEARWTDTTGTSYRSVHTVGGVALMKSDDSKLVANPPTKLAPAVRLTPPSTKSATTTTTATTTTAATTTAAPTTTAAKTTNTTAAPTTTTAAPTTTEAPRLVEASGGWPDAGSTGLRDPALLKPSGSVTVTTNGAVIENLDIKGMITINADNVTVRNVRVTNNGEKYLISIATGRSGIVIEDVELDGRRVATHGIVHGGYTARRVNMYAVGDGFRAGSNTLIEDSWVHGLGHDGAHDPSPHLDAVQALGGSNITIRNNRLEGPWRSQTSAIIFTAHFSTYNNAVIEGNLLSGGTFTLYVRSTSNHSVGNVLVKDNVFVRNSWKFGHLSWDAGTTFSGNGNTFDDGTPS